MERERERKTEKERDRGARGVKTIGTMHGKCEVEGNLLESRVGK